jgi:hypothetical protein
MAIKYTNIFHSKALQIHTYTQKDIFVMQIYQYVCTNGESEDESESILLDILIQSVY